MTQLSLGGIKLKRQLIEMAFYILIYLCLRKVNHTIWDRQYEKWIKDIHDLKTCEKLKTKQWVWMFSIDVIICVIVVNFITIISNGV